jgi:hypothetical protein
MLSLPSYKSSKSHKEVATRAIQPIIQPALKSPANPPKSLDFAFLRISLSGEKSLIPPVNHDPVWKSSDPSAGDVRRFRLPERIREPRRIRRKAEVV